MIRSLLKIAKMWSKSRKYDRKTSNRKKFVISPHTRHLRLSLVCHVQFGK